MGDHKTNVNLGNLGRVDSRNYVFEIHHLKAQFLVGKWAAQCNLYGERGIGHAENIAATRPFSKLLGDFFVDFTADVD